MRVVEDCKCGSRKNSWEKHCYRCQKDFNDYNVHIKQAIAKRSNFVRQVYAISVADNDEAPIKFGFTTNIKARLEQMQTGSPWPLRILASDEGTRANEVYLHRLFADHKVHREWFKRSDEVLAAVSAIKAGQLKQWISVAKQRRRL